MATNCIQCIYVFILIFKDLEEKVSPDLKIFYLCSTLDNLSLGASLA